MLSKFKLRIKSILKQLPSICLQESLGHILIRTLGHIPFTRAPSRLSSVQIEVTGRCNLGCRYCLHHNKKFHDIIGQDIDIDRLLPLIPQLKGVKILRLHGLGEPLLVKNLEDVIRVARRYVETVTFITNGTLLTESRSLSLAKAGLSRLCVSIDSLDPAYHRTVRGTNLERILTNLEFFSRQTRIPIATCSVVSSANTEDLLNLPGILERIPSLDYLHFQVLDGDSFDAEGIDLSGCSADQIKRFEARMSAALADSPSLNSNIATFGLRLCRPRTCPDPWLSLVHINRFGHVNPCCRLPEISLDSIYEKGLWGAWNGPKMKRFRAELLAGNYLSTCEFKCGYKFNGRCSLAEQDVQAHFLDPERCHVNRVKDVADGVRRLKAYCAIDAVGLN